MITHLSAPVCVTAALPCLLAWNAIANELTPASEQAARRGLEWLARNQEPAGNWSSNDLGLVSMGTLAFLSNGHLPGRGEFGRAVDQSLAYLIGNAKPSGLLNISHTQRDLYNHGLATFVLGQAYGMTTSRELDLRPTLDRALKLIAATQCQDGGWDYRAQAAARGHDLSLVVMQAKALRSAADCGLEVPPRVVEAAVRNVREHYWPANGDRTAPEDELRQLDGQFTYSRSGGGATVAMAAAGVVCLQEFGHYDDWRIAKNVAVIERAIRELPAAEANGTLPFDAYTLYYVSQALYQVGGRAWHENYPRLRDYLIASQRLNESDPAWHGSWRDNGANGGGKVGGKPGQLYGTAVACFVLGVPNRYLPILQAAPTDEERDAVKSGTQ